ncbi:hypothetical protein MWN41_08965 [Ornithobacterium rhinotracheale]|uniref:hypothetical protein n=1 Tax=Ornithobacterium rhinotracheale TaxID=28251 RepID=UPI001FF2BADE|nr:hypothetical protein [Ornithobacterium rhinotracheale]MCK0203139.1 hypothetical protein [Ornithobacterium rhinotracheale]
MRKRNIIITLLFLGIGLNAQVAIEKTTFKSEGSILEFNDQRDSGGVAKGIILPVVAEPDAQSVAGTIVYNDKKVKYKSNDSWVDMTDSNSGEVVIPTEEEKGEGAIISDSAPLNTSVPAVLKLESDNKALLLPQVNDVTVDINNPEAGTIAYDKKSKSLAIFNGEYWFFWNKKQ